MGYRMIRSLSLLEEDKQGRGIEGIDFFRSRKGFNFQSGLVEERLIHGFGATDSGKRKRDNVRSILLPNACTTSLLSAHMDRRDTQHFCLAEAIQMYDVRDESQHQIH